MKKIVAIIALILRIHLVEAQNDSIVINKISDNFVEVKSLRHILVRGYSPNVDSVKLANYKKDIVLDGVYMVDDFTPLGPILKDGFVIIKDRHDRPLAIYFYSDSIPIQEDHFHDGRMYRQFIINTADSSFVDKYYWNNGNLRHIIYDDNGKRIVYNYSEGGLFIIEKE